MHGLEEIKAEVLRNQKESGYVQHLFESLFSVEDSLMQNMVPERKNVIHALPDGRKIMSFFTLEQYIMMDRLNEVMCGIIKGGEFEGKNYMPASQRVHDFLRMHLAEGVFDEETFAEAELETWLSLVDNINENYPELLVPLRFALATDGMHGIDIIAFDTQDFLENGIVDPSKNTLVVNSYTSNGKFHSDNMHDLSYCPMKKFSIELAGALKSSAEQFAGEHYRKLTQHGLGWSVNGYNADIETPIKIKQLVKSTVDRLSTKF